MSMNFRNDKTPEGELLRRIEELFPYIKLTYNETEKLVETGINYTWMGDENQTVLHLLFSKKHDNDDKCIQFANALLNLKVDPNAMSNSYHGSFIQTAIYSGYSSRVISTLINLACKKGLLVNAQNKHGDTILHSLIFESECSGQDFLKLYDLLSSKGFNHNILNADGLNVLDAFEQSTILYKGRSIQEVQEFKRKLEEEKEKEFLNVCNDLEDFGTVMNLMNFNTRPTIGREYEVEKLGVALCQKNKSALLIGESGVGKTAIVEQLAYDIQNGDVPRALKNRIILEVAPSELVAGKHFVGDFEKIVKELIDICLDNDVILFIDEIHTLFGTGSHSNSKVDMAQMLKKYLGRTPLKIIGTTTSEEFHNYFYNDALKRRFSIIDVKELDRERLAYVIEKEISDLSNDYFISSDRIFSSNLIEVLLDLTERTNLVFGDTSRNPDLVIGIIRSAFAKAVYDDSDELDSSHIEYGINECVSLKEKAKEEAIDNLDYNCNEVKHRQKVIQFKTKLNV